VATQTWFVAWLLLLSLSASSKAAGIQDQALQMTNFKITSFTPVLVIRMDTFTPLFCLCPLEPPAGHSNTLDICWKNFVGEAVLSILKQNTFGVKS